MRMADIEGGGEREGESEREGDGKMPHTETLYVCVYTRVVPQKTCICFTSPMRPSYNNIETKTALYVQSVQFHSLAPHDISVQIFV